MDYIRRTVCGMLCVDDACIVLRSPLGLAKMMEVIVKVLPSLRLNRVEKSAVLSEVVWNNYYISYVATTKIVAGVYLRSAFSQSYSLSSHRRGR